MDFNYLESYNQFIYKSKVKSSADTEVYYPTHFSISLPKNIKGWRIRSNEFYFEFEGKEMIYIYTDYQNTGKSDAWTVRETTDKEVFQRINWFWEKRNYKEEKLITGHQGRISKIYTDGKVIIMLYNLKNENFEEYLNLVKSFNYLN